MAADRIRKTFAGQYSLDMVRFSTVNVLTQKCSQLRSCFIRVIPIFWFVNPWLQYHVFMVLHELYGTNCTIQFIWYYMNCQGDEGDRSVSMAMENPHKFVLKPQREGGGKF